MNEQKGGTALKVSWYILAIHISTTYVFSIFQVEI